MLRLTIGASVLGLALAGFKLGNLRNSLLELSGKDQELRVCNAIPTDDTLSLIYDGKDLTTNPMDYKECRTFDVSLKTGTKLRFQTSNGTKGTFTVWDTPECDAVLLLVAHRREDAMNSVSFLSHVFCPAKTAQVAVIDTYNDKSPVELVITHAGSKDTLSFDTAVGLSPGSYDIALKAGKEEKNFEFAAQASESYVVLRTGWASKKNSSVPQELVIYPLDEMSKTRSAAVKKEETERSGASSLSASLVLGAAVMLCIQ
eukprot:TRINITY_DN2154_c0_g1_i1.p1 TRINITY_DN2154_c0_g1~~TRINITY_DN2154_c0_g1_i1.p1  ORF type:complete len:259 (-),score=59.37 TRINITY_DN2154_c0_g1_i1:85-861(-)